MNIAPVVIFAYKRLDKISQCLEKLQKCTLACETDVYVFSDGAKGEDDLQEVLDVQNYLDSITHNNIFKNFNVKKNVHNIGLATSVITGVSKVIECRKRVIVLEDDLLPAEDFLVYMNSCLEFYESDHRVSRIGAFTPIGRNVQINPGRVLKAMQGCSWGWATWIDRWKSIDWNIENYFPLSVAERRKIDKVQYGLSKILIQQRKGTVDSWAVRMDVYLIKNSGWTIYPNSSKIANIGYGSSATHTSFFLSEIYEVNAVKEEMNLLPFDKIPDVTKGMRRSLKPSIKERWLFLCHNLFENKENQ